LGAQVVWQIGLAASTTLAIGAFQQPIIAFLFAFLPLMAVVTVGWPAGPLAEVAVIGLLWVLRWSPLMPPFPKSWAVAVAIGGAITGLLGWAATRALLTVTRWSLYTSEQAQERMDELLEQRAELKQIQEDLVHANSELSRLSERLRMMEQAAKEARRLKEEFVANVSHELRTPLNMIIGFSELITQSPQVYGGDLPAALLADIGTIQRNSRHLSRLVDDVLDLSQIETSRMALSRESVSLRGVIASAVDAVQALVESKGLYLDTEIPADLPPVFCDSTRIQQVLLNLLSNAGRFTSEGGVRVKVWRTEEEVLIGVTDTGPGIALKDQGKLFEPFQQVDGSIRRRYGGSGLGLSISKRLVEMHGGKIWLESEIDGGTTITFSLPLQIGHPNAPDRHDAMRWLRPHAQREARARRFKVGDLQPVPRFVLLEGGKTLQRLFRRYIEDVEIDSVDEFEKALLELSRSPAQALVMNVPLNPRLPSPLDRLADLPYGTPTIACSLPGEEEAARRLGVVRYLVKPVDREVLLDTLAEIGDEVKRVLLVDDEPEALQLFSRMLSSAEPSYEVLQATSGQRALGLLRQRRPDAMLLDLVMPGMDGFQVLDAKVEDPSIRDIPVVVISSKDPAGEPIVSDALTVTRSGGLTVPDVLRCIQSVSQILSPPTRNG
jgi:signal transduction histidine kinase/CheY-like chemotaxis protein